MEDIRKEKHLKNIIVQCIKKKDVYLESILVQRKELLSIISDYRDMIDTYTLVSAVTRDDIHIPSHIDGIPTSKGLPGDPVYKTVESRDEKIRDDKIKHCYNEIAAAEKLLVDNLKAHEDALLIIKIYHGTQAVIPAHYYVCHKLWYTRAGTYKSVANDLKISTDKVKVMLSEEIDAICEIMLHISSEEELTPIRLTEELQKAPKLYDNLIRNEK